MENKVLGIDTAKYAKICYILVLIASGFGLFANLLALIGVHMFGGFFTGILGLVGVALTIVAFVGFKDKFSALDVSHFLYLIVIFLASFVFALIVGSLLINLGAFGAILMFLFSAFQFALLWTGFQLWRSGQEATKDNVVAGLKNLPQSFRK